MEQAVPRDPSFDVPVHGATASSLRLQTCARDPPVRILVIDDERSFVSGLAQILRRDGYTVDTADNGIIGLTQLQAHRYDVLSCVTCVCLVSTVQICTPSCCVSMFTCPSG